MKKTWIEKPNPEQQLLMPQLPEIITRLLAKRGLTSEQMVNGFLNPDYSSMHDPFLFKDMQKAVQRIIAAIQNNEIITIYADYDADAVTAAAVMALGLGKMGAVVETYIPDRFSEGYGVNSEAVKQIAQRSKLIVTVDCGTNSVAETKLANSLGVDMIITDHHEITGDLPRAHALINPKNPEDNYPFLYLTGVGVSYKVIQALFASAKVTPEGWEKWLLDLVAIGTVADCQSLTGENRIMVSFGLKVMAKSNWPGVLALIQTAMIKKYDSFAVGFMLAPRINAAGRIKHADLAFKLLTSNNFEKSLQLANELNDLNSKRQILTKQLLSEAKEQIEVMHDKKILLASLSGAEKERLGVVGLVAGRLTEEFGKPVLVLEQSGLMSHGSARSISDFDIIKALSFSKEFLERFGGHTQAAGFTLKSENITKLHEKLLEYADGVEAGYGRSELSVDLKLKLADISFENYEYISKFEPFGIGNPKPKFVTYDTELVSARTVGADNQHLKLVLSQNGRQVAAIGFYMGKLIHSLQQGKKLDIVYYMEANEWNGTKQLELKIIDIKIHE